MIEFQCKSCPQLINANDEYAGKTCKYPTCGTDNIIPGTIEAPTGNASSRVASCKLHLNTRYAGFWKRFRAFLIDMVILVIAGSIISSTVTAIIEPRLVLSGTEPIIIPYISVCVHFAIASILQLLYFTIMESSRLQATPGKMALGIIVTDETGNRISFMRANGRLFAKSLSGMILFIGYIMAGFTQRKQAFHDIIASTYVIEKTN